MDVFQTLECGSGHSRAERAAWWAAKLRDVEIPSYLLMRVTAETEEGVPYCLIGPIELVERDPVVGSLTLGFRITAVQEISFSDLLKIETANLRECAQVLNRRPRHPSARTNEEASALA